MASISFKSKKGSNNDYGLNTGVNFSSKYDYGSAPVQSSPTSKSSTTADGNNVNGGAFDKNTRSQLVNGFNGGNNGVQFNPKYQYSNPMVANQSALDNYYKGAIAADAKDFASGTGLNTYGNTYRILNQRPEAQLTPYAPTSLAGRMTSNPNDGSQMVNPNTDGSGHQWNVEKLKQVMGFDDTQAQNFMKNATLNWQSFNALKQAGAIELDPAHQQYQQYQDYQNQLASQPQYYDDGSYSTGGYSDSSGYGKNDVGNDISNYPQTDDQARQARHYGYEEDGETINNGDYNNYGELTPAGAFNNENAYLKNQLGNDYSPWTGI